MDRTRQDIRSFFSVSGDTVSVTVEKNRGSTPRDVGSWMLVSQSSIFRTIGGGVLEYSAVDKARILLAGEDVSDEMFVTLGPDTGQCCGGQVTLSLKRLDKIGVAEIVDLLDKEISNRPNVYVFGAGHVGKCLVETLFLLPVNPVLVDGRSSELALAPKGVETHLTAMPEEVVRAAPNGSAFIVLTHDHALDFLIVREALARTDACYIGMIGSKTKRARLSRWLTDVEGSSDKLKKLICPIGSTISKDKRPEAIACFVAAEVLAHIGAYDQRPDDHFNDALRLEEA